jgi:hypothetical protein
MVVVAVAALTTLPVDAAEGLAEVLGFLAAVALAPLDKDLPVERPAKLECLAVVVAVELAA